MFGLLLKNGLLFIPTSGHTEKAQKWEIIFHFIFNRMRLKRSGIFNRRLGLQRLRSSNNFPAGSVGILSEVFSQLQIIGTELEIMHPKLYSCICRQVSSIFKNWSRFNKKIYSICTVWLIGCSKSHSYF